MSEYNNKKFIYSGPSWAAQSFNTPDGNEGNTVSLLRQWGLEEVAINVSYRGSNFNSQYDRIKNTELDLPVIYISCEPIAIYNTNPDEYINSYIDNWEAFWDMRTEINKRNMDRLSKLNNPVAIIGAHTDISDVPDNITIIDSSWQNFLRKEAGLDTGYNWGAEVLHTHMRTAKNNILNLLNEKKGSDFIVSKIHDQFEIWKKLEGQGLFCYCHPNRYANKLYARYTSSNVFNFLGL